MPGSRLCVAQIVTSKFSGLRLLFRENLSVALVVRLEVLATAIIHSIIRLRLQGWFTILTEIA